MAYFVVISWLTIDDKINIWKSKKWNFFNTFRNHLQIFNILAILKDLNASCWWSLLNESEIYLLTS